VIGVKYPDHLTRNRALPSVDAFEDIPEEYTLRVEENSVKPRIVFA
jgi:hypothetical protein